MDRLVDHRVGPDSLEPADHVPDETPDLGAVGGSMIVPRDQIHHRSHGDHVALRHLSNHGPLHDRLGGEDADLGWIDDRHGEHGPEPACVVDGEGAALEVVEPELVGPGPSRQILDGAVESVDRQLIRIVDDGHDQTAARRAVDGYRDPDVDAALPQQPFFDVMGVEVRMAMQRLDDGLDHERQEAQPDSLSGLVGAGLFCAQLHDRSHVGLERAVGDRDRGGAGHLCGDPATHLGVRDQNFVLTGRPDDGGRG